MAAHRLALIIGTAQGLTAVCVCGERGPARATSDDAAAGLRIGHSRRFDPEQMALELGRLM